MSQGGRLGVFEDELEHLEGILGRRTPGSKGDRNKGGVHLGELDYGGFKALSRVLAPGRIHLKGNLNLIRQHNSPSLDSSLSSIKLLVSGQVLCGNIFRNTATPKQLPKRVQVN
jgi:hypothetical protein